MYAIYMDGERLGTCDEDAEKIINIAIPMGGVVWRYGEFIRSVPDLPSGIVLITLSNITQFLRVLLRSHRSFEVTIYDTNTERLIHKFMHCKLTNQPIDTSVISWELSDEPVQYPVYLDFHGYEG